MKAYVCLGKEGFAKSAQGKRGLDFTFLIAQILTGWPLEALGTTYRDTRYAMPTRKEVDSYVCHGLLAGHEHCHLPFFSETYFVLCFILVKLISKLKKFFIIF